MSEKTREICTVVSQESIGAGIYSMWIQTDRIAADAKPGQFVSLYTNDKSKILPRPIKMCIRDRSNVEHNIRTLVNLCWMNHKAVSYTHLDVYKRQDLYDHSG